MHEHGHAEVAWSLRYFLDGAGQWADRWTCTGQDVFLAATTISAALLMFAMYVWYAWQTHVALRYVREIHFRYHLHQTRNVFLLCGFIHIMNSVVAWVAPVYFLSACLMLANCAVCARLIGSKRIVLSVQSHIKDARAAEIVSDARSLLKRAHVEDVDALLGKIGDILQEHSTSR